MSVWPSGAALGDAGALDDLAGQIVVHVDEDGGFVDTEHLFIGEALRLAGEAAGENDQKTAEEDECEAGSQHGSSSSVNP